ncbi:hypothetical protein DACRYDRAFT_118879 [Dacryopinax primogenitus]|uniref:Replication factor-A protein 1 N-terminal domain-containing protein n=1 Tax=Dacryopinax primogenitus (strain DJM 731) TaxID=1858805 RepID=M5FXC2_DACPD|nr:uncharacterized protein DACRYDRAFT_118879 [Dacryopinax primogenitus]EJT98126.1 hypothetical protein DACRYDRAFT_118879 [Dacryopinax primogenitus]
MSQYSLTRNACELMVQGLQNHVGLVVQVLLVAPLAQRNPYEPAQYRVELGDGEHWVEATLNYNLNALFRANKICSLMVIRVDSFTRVLYESGKVAKALEGSDGLKRMDCVDRSGDVRALASAPSGDVLFDCWDNEPISDEPISYRTITSATLGGE